MIEKTDIGDLKGIGEKTKKLFEKINVHTVGDLIRYYPHGYDVYEEAVPVSELEEDKILDNWMDEQNFKGEVVRERMGVWQYVSRKLRKGLE